MPVKYTKINNRISDVFENLEDQAIRLKKY